MKHHLVRTALVAALLCGSATALSTVPYAYAAEQPHVSREVGEPLNDAIKAAQKKDWAAAQTALQKAESVSKKSAFDQLKIDQIKAFVAVQQKDYATATEAYEAVVASPAFGTLDPQQQQESLRNALLLSTNAQHWPQVISAAERLQKMTPLDSTALTNLAVAYYNQKDLAKAKNAAEQAMKLDEAAGKPPTQAALQIIMSADANSNDEAGAIKMLEKLTLHYGTPDDWGQLIDNALGTNGITELDALYLYRLRYITHAVTAPDDYTISASIADRRGYPAEAALYLQQGLAAGKITDSGKVATLLAKAKHDKAMDERSLPQIARAAEKARDGKQELVLAEDYWGYNRYADAVTAGQAALAKGVKDTGEAHFIIGIAQAVQGQYDQAKQELAQVDGSPARARAAELWQLWVQSKTQSAAPAASPAPASQPAQH